jgi:hypothetical protein
MATSHSAKTSMGWQKLSAAAPKKVREAQQQKTSAAFASMSLLPLILCIA